MARHYFPFAFVLLSILGSAEGAGLRSPDYSAGDAAEGYYPGGNDEGPDWVKAGMVVEKGFKCKAGADKKKMGAARGCEGGFKQTVSAELAARDLAGAVVATGIVDLRSSMMSVDPKDFFPPQEAMEELARWDAEGDLVFEGEDCSEEGGGCKKKVEFGGYAKVFWGCNITFSMKGKKVSKEVDCGGKSFEGAGMKKNGIDVDPTSLTEDKIVSGFDVFSRHENLKMSAVDNGSSVDTETKTISQRWKEVEPNKRDAYDKLAKAETMRREAEMEIYGTAKPPNGPELSLSSM